MTQENPFTDIETEPKPPAAPKPTVKSTDIPTFVLFNLIVPLALLAVGALAIFLLGKAKAPARELDDMSRSGRLQRLAAVRVEKIQSLSESGQQLQLKVDGTVVPFRESMVAAEVGGRVSFKHEICEAGNVVKKGQLLMRIDQQDYKLKVEQFTRQKEQAYESLMEVDQQMRNSNRMIGVSQKDVTIQEAEVARQEGLPKGFASRAEIDRAKRTLLAAQQQLVRNENDLESLKAKRKSLEAAERLAATQLQVAELDLKRTEILAPIDGVIVRENVDMNSFVNRGTTLVTIEDTSKVEVATSLRIDQLYWVLDQSEQRNRDASGNYDLPDTEAIIEYELTGRDDHTTRWKGRLLGYDGIGLDPATRTVPVRVLVENPQEPITEDGVDAVSGPGTLLRGMYVSVRLLINPRTPLVVIPANAIQPGNRVLQFVQDESVLEVPEQEPKSKDDSAKGTSDMDGKVAEPSESEVAKSESAKAPKTSDESDQASNDGMESEQDAPVKKLAPSFKPKEWAPGRVLVQANVLPVDALMIAQDNAESESETDDEHERRFWVCEIGGESFDSSSFVVTSPLSAVDKKGLPARARLNPKASDADPSETPVGTPSKTDAERTANDKEASAKVDAA